MPPSAESRRTLRLTCSVTLRREGDAAVLTVPETGQIFAMNPSAAIIVERLVAGATRTELVGAVVRAFKTTDGGAPDENAVALDVDRMLFDLAAEGLLDHAAL